MRKWLGVTCVALGVVCLLSAVGLVVYNGWEADKAVETSQTMLKEVRRQMKEQKPAPDQADGSVPTPTEMATVTVDGYRCIGILSVPVLKLELPVLTDWSYAKLKKAPCLYYGSYYEGDFVIAAHNYKGHFGRLSELQEGDRVTFTDVNGVDHHYEVVLVETLPKNATQEMIVSGFDLSLYTCTKGGSNRVTARCRAVKGNG